MNASESANLQVVRRYLAAIEQGADAEVIGQFLHLDIVAHELPNRIAPNGAKRDRAALLAGVERGRELMQSQRYEIRSALSSGPHLALEIDWQGTLAVAFGDQLPAGTILRAHIGIFLELRDGQIIRQRNYDCYEPF